MFGIQDCRGPG